MANEILIKGNEVSLVERKEQGKVTLEEAVDIIRKLAGSPPKFYPMGLTFSHTLNKGDSTYESYIITLPAGIYPFRYRGAAMMHKQVKENAKNNKIQSHLFYIALPFLHLYACWQSDGLVFSNMFATKAPLSSLNDKIYFAPIPNVSETCDVCFGKGLMLPKGTNLEKTRFLMDFYMDSDHNDDYSKFLDVTPAHTFKEWEEKSKKNPSFWIDEKMSANRSFGTLGAFMKYKGLVNE